MSRLVASLGQRRRGRNVDGARAWRIALLLTSALACVSASINVAQAEDESASSGGPQTFRRMKAEQYKASIAQIFGADIAIPGRFEPPIREEGLLAIGDSTVVVTPSGFEQYATRAREISAQVLNDTHRRKLLACEPKSATAFDEACARQFLGHYGRLLFRRPLNDQESASVLGLARRATGNAGSFHKGLESGLASLLVSPAFVFRMETTEPVPGRRGALRLDSYSLATRISFLLWDAPPDEALLDAAASGTLRTQAGLEQQVDRMMASPRFEHGARAFFADMFAYDQFDGLSKDAALFPIFNPRLRDDAEEQSLRTVVDHLLTRNKDYRELFTTRQTFLSRSLGALYGVRVDSSAFEGWMPYTFPDGSPQAGLLTMPAFLMLDPSHEGKTSPTIRGKSVRELFLCQKVPAPPGNVDFSQFQDPRNPDPTVRERLEAHRSNPTCAGCHKIMDPIGLSMENFSAVGQYRSQENGAVIDASGSFEGKNYQDLVGLERILATSQALPNCLVQRVYEYGVGRQIVAGERAWMLHQNQHFAEAGYRFPALIRQIVTSPAFQAVSSGAVASKQTVAAN